MNWLALLLGADALLAVCLLVGLLLGERGDPPQPGAHSVEMQEGETRRLLPPR